MKVIPHGKPRLLILGSMILNLVLLTLISWFTWSGPLHIRARMRKTEAVFKPETRLVILGDSLTQQTTWEYPFSSVTLENRATGGNTTKDILRDLIEFPAKGDRFFLLVGVNDLGKGERPDIILRIFSQIVDQISSLNPRGLIIVHAVLPINEGLKKQNFPTYQVDNSKIRELNQLLSALCEERNIRFLNAPTALESGNGMLSPALTSDGIHLNEKGYELWKEDLEKVVY